LTDGSAAVLVPDSARRSAPPRARGIAKRMVNARLWTHQKGGFFHDGRFATLLDVVNHYDTQFNLNLSEADKKDLVEYLKGI
jgi:cytochrome c peroxidase